MPICDITAVIFAISLHFANNLGGAARACSRVAGKTKSLRYPERQRRRLSAVPLLFISLRANTRTADNGAFRAGILRFPLRADGCISLSYGKELSQLRAPSLLPLVSGYFSR